MKRIIALISSLAILVTMSACSNNKGSFSEVLQTSEKLSFKLANISMSDSFEDIIDISRDPVGGKLLVFGRLASGSYSGYVTTRTFEEYEEFRFTPQEGETVKYAAMLRSGRKAVLTLLDSKTYIYVYGSDNKQEKTIDCGEILNEDDYATLIAGEFGVIIEQSVTGKRELTAVSISDSKVLGKIKLDEDMYIGGATDKDGVPTIVYGDSEKTYTAHLDGTEIVDKTECSSIAMSAYSMCSGYGDYSLVANLGSNLVGLKDSEWVEISTNMDSDLQFYELQSMAMTADDEFAAVQYGSAHSKLVLLSAQDISNLKTKELVTIVNFLPSTSSSGEFDEEIKAFNALSEDYRVEYKSYYNEEAHERDYEHLRLDIISGDGPDIIPFDAVFTPDSLSAGTFCDLYEYIDDDPDLSRDDFIPNVRKAFERDGKMMMVTPTFWNYKTVTAKSGYPGVTENWSFDDMIAAYNAKPEGMYFFDPAEEESTRDLLFDETVMSNFFIDYDKAECWFDSPDYIKMLNFFSDNKIGLTWEEYNNLRGEFHYDDPTNDIIEGKTFIEFMRADCYGFRQLFEKVRYYYGDELVFVGYPYDGKEKGSFIHLDTCLGIVANSPHKDGAWSFLRYLLSDDYYNDPINYDKFPTIESRFDAKAQQCVDGFYDFKQDENGHFLDGEMIKWNWEYPVYEFKDGKAEIKERIKLKPFTQEECDYYRDMIKNSKIMRYDDSIIKIVNEETMSFFNNECTAEDCAKRIQNRASIYLNERYS
ncbi:MAG: carbohydrate ABC transporter substrate-binding protein [Ruminococcus sp.]|nr:carbohydrate ABC transporter substrate-binding protein [Ruminococcus sp.]